MIPGVPSVVIQLIQLTSSVSVHMAYHVVVGDISKQSVQFAANICLIEVTASTIIYAVNATNAENIILQATEIAPRVASKHSPFGSAKLS